MLSMPPATTYLKSPQRRSLAAIITARIPEPQTLLRVRAPVATGQPAAIAAWRAGACPWPAGSTQPMLTCWISSALRPARSMAAAIARAPRAGAERPESAPWKTPVGVRTALKITTSSLTSPDQRRGGGAAAAGRGRRAARAGTDRCGGRPDPVAGCPRPGRHGFTGTIRRPGGTRQDGRRQAARVGHPTGPAPGAGRPDGLVDL